MPTAKKTTAKPKIGRPTKHTDALLNKIVRRFAEGKTFRKIAAMPGYPGESTIGQWRREIPAFAAALARAREERAESFAEQAIDLVDGATNEDLSVIREQVRARQWMAERTAPKQYGAAVNIDAEVTAKSEYPDLPFAQWPYALQMRFAQKLAFLINTGVIAAGALQKPQEPAHPVID
jgi:hypothetical protein